MMKKACFEVWDADTDVFDNAAYMEKAHSRVVSLAELMAEDAEERLEN